MGQLIKLDEQAKYVEKVFKGNMEALSRSVPAGTGDPSRLVRIAYNTIAYDPKILEVCQTQRGMGIVLGCVMEALKLGLTVGGPAGESWIIPFKEKGNPSAQLIIGYQGYRNILDRSKSVLDLHPRAVFANDDFDAVYGTTPAIRHKPWFMIGRDEPGELVAVYAVAHLRGGGVQIEVMPKREVDEHRKRSRAGDSGPWVTDYVPMALKTVIRKIVHYLPKSSELLVRALDLDQRADLGTAQVIEAENWSIEPMQGAVPQAGHSGLNALKTSMQQQRAAQGAAPQPAKPAATREEAERDAEEFVSALDDGPIVAVVEEPEVMSPEENAALDAEISQADVRPMKRAGDLFGGGAPAEAPAKTASEEQVRNMVAGLRKTVARQDQRGR